MLPHVREKGNPLKERGTLVLKGLINKLDTLKREGGDIKKKKK